MSVSLHVMIPQELHDRLSAYLPQKGQKSRLIRALIERQIRHWDARAAAALGRPIPSDGPLESELLELSQEQS